MLRPGGRIVLFEFDLDALVINGSNKALTRRIVHLFTDSMPSGLLGRQLLILLREAGLVDVTAIPMVCEHPFDQLQSVIAGAVSRAQVTGLLAAGDAETWWRDLDRAVHTQRFYAAMPGFVAAGQKPA